MSNLSLISATEFNWYGFIIGSGMVLCIILAYFTAKKRGYYKDIVFDIAIITIPLAIIGARLYYVVFDIIGNPDHDTWTFRKILGLDGGGLSGLAVYGGLIFAALGGLIIHFWKRNKKPVSESVNFAQLLDLGFTFIILGQCIGRWGNFANQEAYGPKVASDVWYNFFPITVHIENGVAGTGEYMATFFYESFWNFCGFFLLYWLYAGKRKSFDGFIFSCYCIYEGIGRAWIEGLRQDSLYVGPVRISQAISFAMILFGIGYIIWHLYKAREKGLKPFIFIEQSKLDESYYGYNKTILHHPCVYEKKVKEETDYSDEFYTEADKGFSGSDDGDFYSQTPDEIDLKEIVDVKDGVSDEDGEINENNETDGDFYN